MSISQIYSPKNAVIAGGNINAMLSLSQGLHNENHEITVLAGWPHTHSMRQLQIHLPNINLQLVPLFTRGPLLRNLECVGRLIPKSYKLRNNSKFSIIHGHSGYAHLSFVTLLLKRIFDIPAIHTLYCPITERLNDKRNFLLRTKNLIRSSLMQMDRIIAINENIKLSLEKIKIPTDKIVTLPPIVRQSNINNSLEEKQILRDRLGIQPNDIMILFVGNFTRAKGFDILLKAFMKIQKMFSNIKLVYTVEHGPKNSKKLAKEMYLTINRYIRDNNIVQLGIVDNIQQLMSIADLFIMPLRETNGPMDYPMALIEAMSVGCPVIATRVGGIEYLIEDGKTGILIEPNNSELLTSAVQKMVCNRTLRTLVAQNAKKFIKNKFNRKYLVYRHIDIYKDVLDRYKERSK